MSVESVHNHDIPYTKQGRILPYSKREEEGEGPN